MTLTKYSWHELVARHLAISSLCAEQQDEVVSELAAHLEETYEAACSDGLDDSAALKLALQEVKNWKALGRRIRRAKSTEEFMNPVTKRYLLPGMSILLAIGLALVLLDRAAFVQRLIWIAEMALLLAAAAYESNRLNQRTRSVWLPGFLSLTAASLFLFAEEAVLAHDPSFFFTNISLRPDHLSSSASRWFYFAWLLAQTLCGAFAAYVSRRAGGALRARIVAAAFPALVMLGLWVVVIPVSALAEHNTFLWNHPLTFLLGVFIWVVPPAIALLAGAAPFFRDLRPAEA